MKIGITCYPTYGGSGALATELGIALARRGHLLLDLQRRLSSTMQLRRVSCDPTQIGENYLLADSRGLLCYTVKEPGAAWADYNNGPVVANYIAQFDTLWAHAIDDPELRVLSL